MEPIVSIIITSYNRSGYVGKAIESALMQDYPALEVVVIDNCSTDNSIEVIKKYQGDPRMKVIQNEVNLGMVGNFQKAIERVAKGDYLSFVSSDDYLTDKQFISRSVSLFRKYPGAVIVTGISNSFLEKTGEYEPVYDERYQQEIRPGKEVFLEFQRGNNPIGFDACMIKSKSVKSIDICYDERMTSLDFEINLKLCLLGDVAFINKNCYTFTIHGDQQSRRTNEETIDANIRILDRARAFAEKQNVFDKRELDEWYGNSLYNILQHNYIKKYICDFTEFQHFKKTFSLRYPDAFKKIKKEKATILLKSVYNQYYNLLGILRYFNPGYYKKVIDYRDS